MFRVGKLFDNEKPILYAGLALLTSSLLGSKTKETWLDHGYIFTNLWLQAVFEVLGVIVFLLGLILLVNYGVRRKWPTKFLFLMLIPLLIIFASLVGDTWLMGRKPLSTSAVVSQSAQLDNGVQIVLLPGPKQDEAGLDTCPMLRLEREVKGGKLREYKTLIILPHHMVARFELVEEGRKIRLIAPSSSIFREIVADFDASWSANASKPAIRFDF